MKVVPVVIGRALLCAALFFDPKAAYSVTTSWIGAVNTDWFNPANWSAGAPGAGDIAVIFPAANQPVIGSPGAVAQEVSNIGTLTVLNGGTLAVNGSGTQAISNGGTIRNDGSIFLGNVSSPGQTAINNYGTILNGFTGVITIDRASISCIFNAAGAIFTNVGLVQIGGAANTGFIGIENYGTFNNNLGGKLTIDRLSSHGVSNRVGGAFYNRFRMSIGENTAFVASSVNNLGYFLNHICGELKLFGPINNTSDWENNGLLLVKTTGSHSNSGTLTNNTVIQYGQQFNPIPNVVNEEIIAPPVISTCQSLSPALQLAASIDRSPSLIWYLDEALTIPAGDFDPVTNVYTPSGFPPNVPTTVYFSVDIPDCGIVPVPILVQYGQRPPAPVVVCLQAFCVGDAPTVASLQPNSPNFIWYDMPSGGVPLPPGTPLANGGDYFVAEITGGCESFRSHVRVIVTTPAPGKICIGGCANSGN